MLGYTKKSTIEIQPSSERVFGFVFAVVFLGIALYPLINEQEIYLWSLVIAVIFLVSALFIPRILRPANQLWMKFGMILHSIVSPIALGVIFFFAVAPVGLLMQLFGKDPLRLRFDSDIETYWIKRDPPGPNPDSLNNQF